MAGPQCGVSQYRLDFVAQGSELDEASSLQLRCLGRQAPERYAVLARDIPGCRLRRHIKGSSELECPFSTEFRNGNFVPTTSNPVD